MGGFEMGHTSRRQLLGLSLSFSVLVAFAHGTTATVASQGVVRSVRQGLVAAKMPGLQPGDRFALDGVSLLVPPPGKGAWGAALQVGGTHRLGIETAVDGSVTVYRQGVITGRGASSKSGLASPAAPSACSDSAYALDGHSWDSRYDWYFNISSTPGEVQQDNARTALRDGITNITHATNDCGLSDKVSATSLYQGETTKSANIGTNSSCKSSDGTNVADFGDLSALDLGYVCWWTQGGKTVESDLRLNKTEYTWFVVLGNNCDGYKYSVEDIATHEFGHTFGLGDLDEVKHANLTMSLISLPCQFAETTLGLGDVLGLEALY